MYYKLHMREVTQLYICSLHSLRRYTSWTVVVHTPVLSFQRCSATLSSTDYRLLIFISHAASQMPPWWIVCEPRVILVFLCPRVSSLLLRDMKPNVLHYMKDVESYWLFKYTWSKIKVLESRHRKGYQFLWMAWNGAKRPSKRVKLSLVLVELQAIDAHLDFVIGKCQTCSEGEREAMIDPASSYRSSYQRLLIAH